MTVKSMGSELPGGVQYPWNDGDSGAVMFTETKIGQAVGSETRTESPTFAILPRAEHEATRGVELCQAIIEAYADKEKIDLVLLFELQELVNRHNFCVEKGIYGG